MEGGEILSQTDEWYSWGPWEASKAQGDDYDQEEVPLRTFPKVQCTPSCVAGERACPCKEVRGH